MQSKKYSFSINKAILKHNVKAFWPVLTMYMIYLTVFILVRTAGIISSFHRYNKGAVVHGQFMSLSENIKQMMSSMTEPISVAIVAVIAVTCVFGYLYNARSSNMMHSFPVTKAELFSTNALSALLILWIPQVVAFILTSALCVICGVPGVLGFFALWLMFEMMYAIFFVAFAVFVAMFTGQAWVVTFFYMAFNFVYELGILLWYMVRTVVSYDLMMSQVTDPEFVNVFSPIVYLLDQTGFETIYDYSVMDMGMVTSRVEVRGVSTALIYAAVGIVFLAGAFLVYICRANETCGDFLTIRQTKPAFRFCMGLFGGCSLGLFAAYLLENVSGDEVNYISYMVFSLIFVIMCYFIAEMFVRKSYRVFKKNIMAEAAICCVLVCTMVFGARASAISDVKYMPGDTSEIVMAGFRAEYPIATIDNKVMLEKVMDVNRFIVDNYDALTAQKKKSMGLSVNEIENMEYVDINIRFRTDKGKLYSKGLWYYYSENEPDSAAYTLAHMIEDMSHDPECYKCYCFSENYANMEVTEVRGWTYSEEEGIIDYSNVSPGSDMDYMFYQGISRIAADKSLRQELYKALQADIDAGKVSYARNPDSNKAYRYQIELELRSLNGPFANPTNLFWSADPDADRTDTIKSASLFINEDCTNTMNLIQKAFRG